MKFGRAPTTCMMYNFISLEFLTALNTAKPAGLLLSIPQLARVVDQNQLLEPSHQIKLGKILGLPFPDFHPIFFGETAHQTLPGVLLRKLFPQEEQ